MSASRVVFVGISISLIAWLLLFRELEKAIAGSVLILLAATMVWYNSFWARYILRWGFLESFASDFKSAGRSSAAIAFLGWVVLLLTGLLLIFD